MEMRISSKISSRIKSQELLADFLTCFKIVFTQFLVNRFDAINDLLLEIYEHLLEYIFRITKLKFSRNASFVVKYFKVIYSKQRIKVFCVDRS